MPAELIELTLKTLRKYAVFSRVTLEHSTAFTQCLGILGDTMLGTLPIQLPNSTPQTANTVLTHTGYTLYQVPGIPTRWELLVHHTAAPVTPLHTDLHWQAHTILAGIPTLCQATSGHYTPHKLGLIDLNAISFNKGCYLGQEIIARTHYLGTQKGGLYWARTQTPQDWTPAMEILDAQQQVVGNLINVVTLDKQYTLLLAALKQTPTPESDWSIASEHLQFSPIFSR